MEEMLEEMSMGPLPDKLEQSACPFAPLLRERVWSQFLFCFMSKLDFQVNVLFEVALASSPWSVNNKMECPKIICLISPLLAGNSFLHKEIYAVTLFGVIP